MGSNREMIDAFVSGQLSEADHDLMAHHIATCEQCAAAVAAERAVRGELAKLLAPPDALVPQAPVVSSADLSVPAVPELQLDFVLDRTSEAAGLLLPREPVREVALDQLPPAPAHSERRSERRDVGSDATADGVREPPAGERPRFAYADDTEVAAATAAGIADSVAHGAAVLASNSPWEGLDAGSEDSVSAEDSPVVVQTEARVIEEELAVTTPEAAPASDRADLIEHPASGAIGDAPVVEEVARIQTDELAVVADAAPVGTNAENVIEGVVPVLTEDPLRVEETVAARVDDVALIWQAPPEVVESASAGEEGAEGVNGAPNGGAGAEAEELPMAGDEAEELLIATTTVSQERSATAGVSDEPESVALTVVRVAPGRRTRRRGLWGAAAAVLVIGLASVYAAGQLQSSGEIGLSSARGGEAAVVAENDVAWRMTPSVLMPILDSAVYNRVIDVTTATDSLADSVDTTGAREQTASDSAPPPASSASIAAPRPARRARTPERLPQIVSDPPEADASPPRSPPGEALPEVMRRNAPARTTTRGSAVVISGVPDVPRLLRTTTHRPRADVAYVLREYDASAAEPAPRAGVNEYRWSDATGSRLYVLSGPVGVAELRAYARQLQAR